MVLYRKLDVHWGTYSLVIGVVGQLAVVLALHLLPGLAQLLTPETGTQTSEPVPLLV